jgi:tetratricopeptide (TPR) repeat protein
MIEWESDLATDQQRSVVATFDTLLDQLGREIPESYYILIVLSFVDPEDIPLAMLKDGARMASLLLDKSSLGNSPRESRTITRITEQPHNQRSSQHHSQNTGRSSSPTNLPELRALVPLILSPTAFPKARHKLQSLSLAEPLSRDGQSSLRVHDLVHFMTREHVKRRMPYQAWLESAVSIVCGALRCVEDPELLRWWPECERLISHVRSLSRVWTGVEGVNMELVAADVSLARYLYSRGRYDEAEKLCESSVGSLRKELGDEHKDTLSALYILARVCRNQGRLTEAAEAFEHVLAVEMKQLGPHHQDTLATMNELARIYRRQGSHQEAEELFKRVLAVKQKIFGPDHLSTLSTMSNLAAVYHSQKRYEEAEKLYERVLALQEKHLSPDDLSTLTTANNLGSVYLSQKKYIEAEGLATRALVGYERQLGPGHPHTLTAAANLAHIYELQARNDEAEQLYLHAFTGMKQQLGSNHRDTVARGRDLASFYRYQGRNSEADMLLDSLRG